MISEELKGSFTLREGNVFTRVCQSVHKGCLVPGGVVWSEAYGGYGSSGVGKAVAPSPGTTKVGGMHSTGMLSCYLIPTLGQGSHFSGLTKFPDYQPQQSWAKVIFSQVSVCPQGGSASVHAGIYPPGSRHPPGSRPPWGSRLQHMVNERPVRILLECILVFPVLFAIFQYFLNVFF